MNTRRAATLHDVATAAGVSTATAARALGDYGSVRAETRERVAAAAARLGYSRNELASSMITGRTSSIGLIVGDIENPFFSSLARTAIDAAKSLGYDVLVTNTDEDLDAERTALRVLAEKRVDGVIVAPVYSEGSPHLVELAARGMPLVLVNGTIPDIAADCIIADNAAGAGDAVDHLIGIGHERIAVIARSSVIPGASESAELYSQSGSERVEGYRRALERAGIAPDPRYQHGGGLRIEDAEAAAHALLDLNEPPTAIVTTNSVIVLGVLRALRARGLSAPGDLSVINFDDPPWAELASPSLTTIEQPTRRMGELAVELLKRRIDADGHAPALYRLGTTMHVRASTAPPPRG